MSYKIVQLNHPQSLFQQSAQLDKTRNTAILIRQSRRGSDKTHIEGRMLQESLIPFVQLAREEETLEHIHIFDEGSGVSGTKGVDRRKKLKSMMEEMVDNLIGDIVLARPDRLFRDKHFSNVSAFTELAEKMKVKVIVPKERGVLVYDFTKYEDLKEFQRAMQEAYAYIDTQIGYMNRARAFKVAKGYYGGGNIILPYVLLRDMPKEQQVIVVYDPWKEQALDLFTKFQEFNFQTSRLARHIEEKPYLFKCMDESHLEEYQVVTTMSKANGGYTIATMESLRRYLKNLTLAGFVKAGKEVTTGEIILIPNVIDAVVPLELFDPCFASLTGEHLDGTPFERKRHFKGGANENVDAILHGLLSSDEGDIGVFANADIDYPIYDLRNYNKGGIGKTETLWSIAARPVDRIVLDRLIALAEYDNTLVDRVKQFFAEAHKEGENSLVVLDTAIIKTQEAIQRVGRTIVKLTKGLFDEQGNPIELADNDPNIVEQRNLYMQLRRLQKQRDDAARLSNEDPSASITNFYHVLSHLTTEFHKLPPQTKKDFMRRLIDEVKIQSISPHLFLLHITWIRPLTNERADRTDVALLWRCTPTKSDEVNVWTPEEDDALRALYPNAPQLALMQSIPYKTPGMMKNRAFHLGVRREGKKYDSERFSLTVMYADLEAANLFAKNDKDRNVLWNEINTLSQQAKKGKDTNITALWLFAVDMGSFIQSHNVTDVVTAALSGQARLAT